MSLDLEKLKRDKWTNCMTTPFSMVDKPTGGASKQNTIVHRGQDIIEIEIPMIVRIACFFQSISEGFLSSNAMFFVITRRIPARRQSDVFLPKA